METARIKREVAEYLDSLFELWKREVAHDHRAAGVAFAKYLDNMPQGTFSSLLNGIQIPTLKSVRRISKGAAKIEREMRAQGKEIPAELKPARIYQITGYEMEAAADIETAEFLEDFSKLTDQEKQEILDLMRRRQKGEDPAGNEVHGHGNPAPQPVEAGN